ncbi:phosphatidylethanolamine N-methyltransferase [Mycoemilia scoparia]|uniref:Phosphatidylethanolamine N-methyltransferase n=1 Tax=Mycoemilia scoparia TaxID=417184 RepID=A0A9W8A619_9FUNG|nr:phosphatidylethanolamine N-methyltransferase [Mycoemilia scoparia]
MPIRKRRGAKSKSISPIAEQIESLLQSPSKNPNNGSDASLTKTSPESISETTTLVDGSKAANGELQDGKGQKSKPNGKNMVVAEDEQPLMGHISNGKRFVVPKTHDMISSLFDPTKSKTAFDWIILGTLSLHAIVYFAFPSHIKKPLLLAGFIFWRLAYNAGLGLLLMWQSKRKGVVNYLKVNKVLTADSKCKSAGNGGGGALSKWVRQQLESKMGIDYDYDAVPIEFNSWLLYRQLVDLVLLNDFFAYFFFGLCYIGSSPDVWWKVFIRQAAGWMLLAFNVWVKVDAHRVVKDYAWYWGDFFFLVDQSLTFDGVFEMAPHPMYSIGYAGYYGGSLITGSYTLFYVSLAAHISQFLFLSLVENPHIEKTYERPPTALKLWRQKKEMSKAQKSETGAQKQRPDIAEPTEANDNLSFSSDGTSSVASEMANDSAISAWTPYFRNELIIFKNIDLFRASDLMLVLLVLYGVALPIAGCITFPSSSLVTQGWIFWFAIGQCLFWILFRTLGLGYVLKRQSDSQWYLHWFIKHGGTAHEAFSSWRSIYNAALVMNYASFILLTVAAYLWKGTPSGSSVLGSSGFLAPTLGLLLIAFHIWSSLSVYDTLGDFGWFYGDFFVQNLPTDRQKLAFTGVYRYLNNPEKVIGQSAFYGLALLAGSWVVLGLAMTMQCANFLFLTYVETPHMYKLYGSQLNRDSGVVRTIKNAHWASPIIKGLGIDLVNDDVHAQPLEAVDNEPVKDILKMMAEKTNSVRSILNDTKNMLTSATTKLAEQTLPADLSKVKHLSHYRIQLQDSAPTGGVAANIIKPASGSSLSESTVKDLASHPRYVLGEPIRMSWCVPTTHSRKDWVGLYPVTSNPSSQVTIVSSQNRYVYIRPDEELLFGMVPGDSVFASITHGLTSVPENGPDDRLNGNRVTPSSPPASDSDQSDSEEKIVGVYYGETTFSSNSLPWSTGIYEMRLHQGNTHVVLAKSPPFEIVAPKLWPDSPSLETVATNLLPLVNRCLAVTLTDASSHIGTPVPGQVGSSTPPLVSEISNMRVEIVEPLHSVNDLLATDGELDERQAERLAYAIRASFGIEFDPAVLVHAAKSSVTVLRVAERIFEARRTLEALSSTNMN